MTRKSSLSATNLAAYHHFNCDLFLYNTYHGVTSEIATASETTQGTGNELTKAQFKRGQDWERCLMLWLDKQNLLLTVPSSPLRGEDLVENLVAEDRDHFFVAGISFIPPQDELDALYKEAGFEPVKFSIAKPDLLEIIRTPDGVLWKVIDAKASRSVKTSHHAQIYFYTLCLKYMLREPFFRATNTAAIWLPPPDGFGIHAPSFDDLKTVDVSLLSFPLNEFLFHRLPQLLSIPRGKVSWHYNTLCRGCPFAKDCKQKAIEQGELGSLNNISIEDARLLRKLLNIWRKMNPLRHEIPDIEDLSLLLADGDVVNEITSSHPITMRRARRILALPGRSRKDSRRAMVSPVVEAARTGQIQIISRRNFTCPSKEDISVVLSLLQDSSSPASSIVAFSISIFSSLPLPGVPELLHGDTSELIPSLAYVIESILSHQSSLPATPSTQFYVFSSAELSALQAHFIDAALVSSHPIRDIRLCIGALAQGASLLQTTFQPVLLSGVLLDFLAKGQQKKSDLQACLERMDLPTEGRVPQLRQRIRDELKRFQHDGVRTLANDERHRELGQLLPVVVLQKELERLMKLPITGYWDLSDCASALVSRGLFGFNCPSDEDIYEAFVDEVPLSALLEHRNKYIHAVLQAMRTRIASTGHDILVNSAKPLSASFMDICREDHLRKLFYMQQFEILTSLSELWRSRIDGCPDSPILQYEHTQQGPKGTLEHTFSIVSGMLEMTATDKSRAFFNYILALDIVNCDDSGLDEQLPVEALFDDLAVSGLVFPLNRWTMPKWTAQHSRVQRELLVADIRDIVIEDRRTMVTLQTFGGGDLKFSKGKNYRISHRLVDFNVSKILTTLFELDLQHEMGDKAVPFLQLIVNPRAFRQNVDPIQAESSKAFQKSGTDMQRLFQELKNLNVERATSLVLKPSQNFAAQHILMNRLSVIWGPPGTGKTHTIALSLLRYLNAHYKLKDRISDSQRKIVFVTALTHAAIEAFLNKLRHLIQCYRSIDELPTEWLDNIVIEHVLKGSEHPAPTPSGIKSMIYAGTIYQLYNFSKSSTFSVDCVVIDEAGQLALSSASLAMRSLTPKGKIVIAGDSEQLSPILSAEYPQLKSGPIFGSILDSLMYFSERSSNGAQDVVRPPSPSPTDSSDISLTQSTVIQLTENFRLNPDLGEFVSTIYSRAFRPQKVQARQLAIALKGVKTDLGRNFGIRGDIMDAVQWILLALSNAMLNQPQNILAPPAITGGVETHNSLMKTVTVGIQQDIAGTHKPISLVLIRLQTFSSQTLEGISYEAHIEAEAAIAAALVLSIRRSVPTDDIFVATPHRVQRQAVKAALEIAKSKSHIDDLVEALEINLQEDGDPESTRQGAVRVDTIERLQGSEAAFVICLFSLPQSHSSDLKFLLERRRLNVAISRAKTLCILISSSEILRPSVSVLKDEQSAKGFAFLRAFEDRAWSSDIRVDVDQ